MAQRGGCWGEVVTHDFSVVMLRTWSKNLNVETISPITLNSNIFVGLNTIIMPGSTIGDNTIIAAGSIVTGQLEGALFMQEYLLNKFEKLRTMLKF